MYTKEDLLQLIAMMEEKDAKYVFYDFDYYDGDHAYLLDKDENEIEKLF